MKAKLLTISQAARQKGVSRNALYKAVADKRLKSSVVLGRLVIRESDLLVWKPRQGQQAGQPRSAEVKARISASQKRRWAERRGKESGS